MTIAELIRQHTSAKPEKRKHPRLSLRLPTEYSLEGSPRVRIGHTVDICEGGLLIQTPEKVEVHQNLRVKFYYHSASDLNSIQALAEVVRVDSLGKSRKEYRCALHFIDLSPDNLQRLRKFLKSIY